MVVGIEHGAEEGLIEETMYEKMISTVSWKNFYRSLR